jgi:hypothetical protein
LREIYYQLVPQPNTADNPLINGNDVGAVPIFQVAPQETARLYHVFNKSNRGYVRFTDQQSGVKVTGGVQDIAISGIPAEAALGYNNNPSQSLAGGSWVHAYFLTDGMHGKPLSGVPKVIVLRVFGSDIGTRTRTRRVE